MPDNRHNVMPFQQDAGFFARRALKKQRDGQFQQAVVLLRHALEAAPDHAEYLLDMAETYSEMGCPIESNRCLLRLMALQPALSVCWFGLSCNLFAMGNVQGAQLAALEYLEREPQGEYGEQAAGMIAAIQQAQQVHRPPERRQLRVYRLNERAAARLNGEHPAQAVRLLEKSLAMLDTPDTRALYAFALSEAGRPKEAVRAANEALRRRHLSGEARVNALWALINGGARSHALRLTALMDKRRLEPYELRRALDAQLSLKRDRSMQAQLSQALRLSPFDRALLHAQAAAFYNEGDAERALVWWRHMLEINPADALAAICVDAVTGDCPPERPIPMTLLLPRALAQAQRDIIRAEDGPALITACRWALLNGSPHAAPQRDGVAFLAARRLGALEDGESELLLREALIEPTLAPAVKLAVREALARRGAAKPLLEIGRDTLSPAPQESRAIAPTRALKACLAAAYALDTALIPAFLGRWSAALPQLAGRRFDALLGCGMSLLWQIAREHGLTGRDLRETLALSPRRLDYYAKKLNRLTGGHAQ